MLLYEKAVHVLFYPPFFLLLFQRESERGWFSGVCCCFVLFFFGFRIWGIYLGEWYNPFKDTFDLTKTPRTVRGPTSWKICAVRYQSDSTRRTVGSLPPSDLESRSLDGESPFQPCRWQLSIGEERFPPNVSVLSLSTMVVKIRKESVKIENTKGGRKEMIDRNTEVPVTFSSRLRSNESLKRKRLLPNGTVKFVVS